MADVTYEIDSDGVAVVTWDLLVVVWELQP